MRRLIERYENFVTGEETRGARNHTCIHKSLDPAGGRLIKQIWEHPRIEDVFERRSEYQLNDNAEYFLNKVEVISASDYVPTVDDVLRARVRSIGIVQSDFKIKSLDFRMCPHSPSSRPFHCWPS